MNLLQNEGRSRRRDRGAVLIICTVLMASVSTILISTADLGQFTNRQQTAMETETLWQYTEDSVEAIITQKQIEKSLIMPGTLAFTINNADVRVTSESGTGAMSRFIKLTTTYSDRKLSRTRATFIGNRTTPSPMWFAYSTPNSTDLSNDISCDSDIYNSGDITGSGTMSTTAKLYTAQSALTVSPTASEGIELSAQSFAPTFNVADYQAAAALPTTGPQSVTLLTFLSLGAFQTLWFNKGSATFDVNYTGRGTCVNDGNVVIMKFNRTLSSDEGLLIVNGDIDIQTNSIQGFIFCTGTITYSATGNLTIDGALCCNKLVMNGKKATVKFDSFFWDDPQWDKRMRVPGMW